MSLHHVSRAGIVGLVATIVTSWVVVGLFVWSVFFL